MWHENNHAQGREEVDYVMIAFVCRESRNVSRENLGCALVGLQEMMLRK